MPFWAMPAKLQSMRQMRYVIVKFFGRERTDRRRCFVVQGNS